MNRKTRRQILMTEEEATVETRRLFGPDSFAEADRGEGLTRYYVGKCPRTPGPYTGFMGFSWEQALQFAEKATQ